MTTIVSGSSITFNDNTTQNTSAYGGGFAFRNRIINGDCRIDQRNAGASVTPTATTYTLDRWSLEISEASKLSVQQNASSVTPPIGFTNYLGITTVSAFSIVAASQFQLRQFIEGFNIADLAWGTANAKTVTLSFWVRSSLTGTFGGAFRNEGNNRSYPFSYTISSANTWTQISITVAGDTTGTWLTNNDRGITVLFGLGVGSDKSGTAGAWAASNFTSATGATSVVGTNGATWYITGVQLEKGSTATSFDYRPYGQELQLCQRYYEKSYAQGTVAGTAQSYPAYGTYFNGMSNTSGQKIIILPFKATKRASPTMTYYDAAGTSGKITTVDIGGTNTNNVAIALSFVNDAMYAAGASNGTHTGLYYDWTSSAEL